MSCQAQITRDLNKHGLPEGTMSVEVYYRDNKTCSSYYYQIDNNKDWIGYDEETEIETIFTREEFLDNLIKIINDKKYKVHIIQCVRKEIIVKDGIGFISCVSDEKECVERFTYN